MDNHLIFYLSKSFKAHQSKLPSPLTRVDIFNFLPDALHMEDHNMKVHRALYVGQHHLHLDDAVSCKEDHHRNHILKNTNTQYMYHQKVTSVK